MHVYLIERKAPCEKHWSVFYGAPIFPARKEATDWIGSRFPAPATSKYQYAFRARKYERK